MKLLAGADRSLTKINRPVSAFQALVGRYVFVTFGGLA